MTVGLAIWCTVAWVVTGFIAYGLWLESKAWDRLFDRIDERAERRWKERQASEKARDELDPPRPERID
jgi:hypothetical protein